VGAQRAGRRSASTGTPSRGTTRPGHSTRQMSQSAASAPVVEAQSAGEILALQRTAGNRAVTSAIVALQRAGGWGDASATPGVDEQGARLAQGWNAAEQAVGNVRRIPIDGLKGGNQAAVRGGASSQLTDESAAGRAIALVPSGLDPTQKADALLHFHGLAERKSRDFAGWRQTLGGTVRDVARDRIAQQIEAAGQPQLIGVLPQGGEKSDFGTMNADGYIKEVFARLQQVGALAQAPELGRVVTSAHSGGGRVIRKMLAGGKGSGAPSNLGMVALFDGIWAEVKDGKAVMAGELKTIRDWAIGELNRLRDVVTSGATTTAKDAALANAPRLRAYYTRSSSRYRPIHQALEQEITAWFAKHGPQLGSLAAPMSQLFQVVAMKTGNHETIVRDKLEHALGGLATASGGLPGVPPAATGGAPSSATTSPAPAKGAGGPTAPPAPAPPAPAAAGPAPSGAAASSGILGTLRAAGGALGYLAGVAMTSGLDEASLTNALFFLRHPELNGRKIAPGEKALAREWVQIRDQTVRPFLARLKATPGEAPSSGKKAAPAAAPAAVPAAKTAAPQPEQEPTEVVEPTPDTRRFVHDALRSTVERLPASERARFEKIKWGWLDYPGNKSDPVKGMKADQLAEYHSDAAIVLHSSGAYFVGKHQKEAQALFDALMKVRPGGGERRANAGAAAVLTKAQFRKDPVAFDDYIESQLAYLDGQTRVKKKQMNKHAAEAFASMRKAARADGVTITVGNAYRERKTAEKSAAKSGNAKAVASFSSHSLGLAMDLVLWVPEMAQTGKKWTESSTKKFPNVVRMLSSPAYKWLYMNGASYGFYQYRNEPWHWEYNPPGFQEKFFSEDPALKPGS
jgi:D-alanyl-D-alanine dipeptidase